MGDGIATVYGLKNAMMSELLLFPHDVYGMVMNLEDEQVGVSLCLITDVAMIVQCFTDCSNRHLTGCSDVLHGYHKAMLLSFQRCLRLRKNSPFVSP